MEKPERTITDIRKNEFPWWLVIIGVIIAVTLLLIINTPSFNDAFATMRVGILTTISITLIAYSISLVVGLIVGLGRVSSNVVAKNLSTFYIELVRGIPMLVLIFFIALVVIPAGINGVGILNCGIIDHIWRFFSRDLPRRHSIGACRTNGSGALTGDELWSGDAACDPAAGDPQRIASNRQ